MKKFLLAIVVAMLVIGCSRPKSPEAMAKLKGTWRVININCPYILAQKSGETQIFQAQSNSFGKCYDDIKPGWIVVVDDSGDYAFFPPPQSKSATCQTQ